MPSRPEVSRALEAHGQETCRSCCSSVKLLTQTPRKPGKSLHPSVPYVGQKNLHEIPAKKDPPKAVMSHEKYRVMSAAGIMPFSVLNTSKLLSPVKQMSLVGDQSLLERRDLQRLES